jgi:hypothetical protein
VEIWTGLCAILAVVWALEVVVYLGLYLTERARPG